MKVTENEIRPKEIFDEYLRLATIDTETYFRHSRRELISCPSCKSPGNQLFNKAGFDYQECPECKTIFVNPRPVKEAFDAYYTDSPSTKYWASTFYKVTETARREKLWKPKAKFIKDKLQVYGAKDLFKYIVDIGGGYGVFDEEIMLLMNVKPIVIEPSIHLAKICRDKEFIVIEKFMEDVTFNELPEGRKCFVSFELFEHLFDPTQFLQTVYNVMNSNDIFLFTTLSSMGIDIQVLGQNSKSISPPHHLNFFNPKSISRLLESIGFHVLEVSTPGKLDIDILKNNKNHVYEPSWKNILEYSNEEELAHLQDVIASCGLSSHMMIICVKH